MVRWTQHCHDTEHGYFRILEPWVFAEDDDIWWAEGLRHPCGLPGHVHELYSCLEFLKMPCSAATLGLCAKPALVPKPYAALFDRSVSTGSPQR